MLLFRSILCVFVCLALIACAVPQVQQRLPVTIDQPRLGDKSVRMRDGQEVPLRHWRAPVPLQGVVLALHGFNDYSNFFAPAGEYLAKLGIESWAIDQRGFGATSQAGLWAGREVMQDDVIETLRLLCARYPGTPVYLFGESMGGAVILATGARLRTTCVQGLVLSAPAVWGWTTMPWYQRAALWLAAHTLPGQTVTGANLDIRPSDNIGMLRALGRDPLVIKATRIDALYGLTDLMQAAADNSANQQLPVLMLYGERDEIITPVPTCDMLHKLQDFNSRDWRLLLYPDGYHMLTRDLQGNVVMQDLAQWILSQRTSLPAAREVSPRHERVQALCGQS